MYGLILTRKGSKRLPNKSTKLLCGKPLTEWTFIEAEKSNLEGVYVASDDPEIKKLAEQYGFINLDRKEEVSGDKILSEETINSLNLNQDIILLQVTSPLRTKQHINEILKQFKGQPIKSVDEHHCPNGAMYIIPKDYKERLNDIQDVYEMTDEESLQVDCICDFKKIKEVKW